MKAILLATIAAVLALIAANAQQPQPQQPQQPQQLSRFAVNVGGGYNAVEFSQSAIALDAKSETIVNCNRNKESGQPYDCHFVGKHNLDEVMAVLWQEAQDRKALGEELRDELKQRMKAKPQ
jgi:hypothetical protein